MLVCYQKRQPVNGEPQLTYPTVTAMAVGLRLGTLVPKDRKSRQRKLRRTGDDVWRSENCVRPWRYCLALEREYFNVTQIVHARISELS